MNKTELRNQIEARIAFDKEIYQLLKDQLTLTRECARQSQIVAALVLQNGGFVDAEIWQKCSENLDRFIPQGLSVVPKSEETSGGVQITIHEKSTG